MRAVSDSSKRNNRHTQSKRRSRLNLGDAKAVGAIRLLDLFPRGSVTGALARAGEGALAIPGAGWGHWLKALCELGRGSAIEGGSKPFAPGLGQLKKSVGVRHVGVR